MSRLSYHQPITYTPVRMFFGGKKDHDHKEPKEPKEAKAKKEEEPKEESESEPELNPADIKKIRQLFQEQEVEIEALKKQLEEEAAKIEKSDKEMKLFRIEYTKQVRENEDTVKRYRKMIEDEK